MGHQRTDLQISLALWWKNLKATNPVLKPTLIPFYKPDVYPIVLQRSVSVYGQLLGSSDVDAIEDQQNTINRLEQKIIDRLIKAGTRITLQAQQAQAQTMPGQALAGGGMPAPGTNPQVSPAMGG